MNTGLNYGETPRPTQKELRDAYIDRAPACHHPSATGEVVPVEEVPEDFLGPIATELARGVESEIELFADLESIGDKTDSGDEDVA